MFAKIVIFGKIEVGPNSTKVPCFLYGNIFVRAYGTNYFYRIKMRFATKVLPPHGGWVI